MASIDKGDIVATWLHDEWTVGECQNHGGSFAAGDPSAMVKWFGDTNLRMWAPLDKLRLYIPAQRWDESKG